MGVLSKDVISIGSSSNKLSTSAYFLSVTNVSSNFVHIDGKLGLAFNALSGGNATFIDLLQQNDVIKNRIFGFYLNSASFSDFEYGSPASNLQIGGYDLKTYSTSATFEAEFVLSDVRWWTVAFVSCSINGTITLAINFAGKFDSGSPLTIVPDSVFNSIYNYLVSFQGRKCEIDSVLNMILCEDINRTGLPGLTLVTSTGSITGAAKNLWWCKSGQCLFLVAEGDEWIFGDSFLRTYYTVYDMDYLKISFAPAVNSKAGTAGMIRIGLLAVVLGFS
jgi:hypothetical protein